MADSVKIRAVFVQHLARLNELLVSEGIAIGAEGQTAEVVQIFWRMFSAIDIENKTFDWRTIMLN